MFLYNCSDDVLLLLTGLSKKIDRVRFERHVEFGSHWNDISGSETCITDVS